MSRYKQPLRLCMRNEILRSANAKYHYSYLFFYKVNKGDLPLVYSSVFWCQFIDFVGFFGCYCFTPVTLFIQDDVPYGLPALACEQALPGFEGGGEEKGEEELALASHKFEFRPQNPLNLSSGVESFPLPPHTPGRACSQATSAHPKYKR